VTSNQSVTARFDSNCSGGRSFDVRSHSWKMLANLFSCRPTSPLNMCTNPTKKSIGFRDASNCCCKVSLYRALHCTYGGKTNPLCVRSYIYQPFQLYLHIFALSSRARNRLRFETRAIRGRSAGPHTASMIGLQYRRGR